jgi:hypothetical protein
MWRHVRDIAKRTVRPSQDCADVADGLAKAAGFKSAGFKY